MTMSSLRRALACLGLAVLVSYGVAAGLTASPTLDAPAVAQVKGNVPGDTLGNVSDALQWRGVRHGETGTVSLPDKKAAVMVQSQGEDWRTVRNRIVITYGAWVLLVTVVCLALFFVFRGRIRIESGFSGRLIQRFTDIEVFTHWLTAFSFIILGLTGLNMMYGKYFLMPLIGQPAFATLSWWCKHAHNYIAFGFMLGVLGMVVLWIRDNIWDRYDWRWMITAGGLFTKGLHPPAGKFNFGQKTQFWLILLGGIAMAFTGLNLMFPFLLGNIHLMQILQVIHGALGVIMVAAILGHIYIGTLGMEGAFWAMGTGYVDENWLREHHSAFLEEKLSEVPAGGEQQPAE